MVTQSPPMLPRMRVENGIGRRDSEDQEDKREEEEDEEEEGVAAELEEIHRKMLSSLSDNIYSIRFACVLYSFACVYIIHTYINTHHASFYDIIIHKYIYIHNITHIYIHIRYV